MNLGPFGPHQRCFTPFHFNFLRVFLNKITINKIYGEVC